jgi:hypothetical protein
VNSPGAWTVTGAGASATLTGTLTNSGSVVMQNGASVTASGLSNSGGLAVDESGPGGSSLDVAGTLTNSASLRIGNNVMSQAATVTAAGLVNTGTLDVISGTAKATLTAGTLANTGVINMAGGTTQAAVDIGAPAPSTWTGTAQLSGNALLQFSGTNQIGTIGTNSGILLSGPQAFVAAAGINSTSNSALSGLSTIASGGGLSLSEGASLTTNGGLTVSAAIGTGPNGSLGVTGATGNSTLDIGGTRTNGGALSIGTFSVFSGAATVTASALANTGEIVIEGSSTSKGALEIGSPASSTWTGTALLSGNALLQFAGTSQINTIGANAEISLTGPQAFVAAAGLGTTTNSALTSLSSNAGTFMILSAGTPGATLTTTALTNSGNTEIDAGIGGLGGSTFNIGGTLTNSGTFGIGAGTSANNIASSNVTASGLIDTGFVVVQAGSSAPDNLTVNGPASNSGTGEVNIGLFSNLTVTGAGSTYLQAGGSTTVSGRLTSPTVNVTGGSLTLTSNSFFGQTGTVVGNVDATGGTVLGNGIINGNVNISSAGAIEANDLTSSPTPGTLTVNGNYAQSGGTFDAELRGTGVQLNEVNITNGHTVTLTGGDLEPMSPSPKGSP